MTTTQTQQTQTDTQIQPTHLKQQVGACNVREQQVLCSISRMPYRVIVMGALEASSGTWPDTLSIRGGLSSVSISGEEPLSIDQVEALKREIGGDSLQYTDPRGNVVELNITHFEGVPGMPLRNGYYLDMTIKVPPPYLPEGTNGEIVVDFSRIPGFEAFPSLGLVKTHKASPVGSHPNVQVYVQKGVQVTGDTTNAIEETTNAANDLFGLTNRDTTVIMTGDDNSYAPVAGQTPQEGYFFMGNSRDPVITAFHEAFHTIVDAFDPPLHFGAFEKLYNHEQIRPLLAYINESKFFPGTNGGHAEKNVSEAIASLLNSINADDVVWTASVNEMPDTIRAAYFQAILALEQSLEGRIDATAGVFELLNKRKEQLQQWED